MSQQVKVVKSLEGRAKNGGARPNSGRKPSETKKALAQILDEAVTDDDRK